MSARWPFGDLTLTAHIFTARRGISAVPSARLGQAQAASGSPGNAAQISNRVRSVSDGLAAPSRARSRAWWTTGGYRCKVRRARSPTGRYVLTWMKRHGNGPDHRSWGQQSTAMYFVDPALTKNEVKMNRGDFTDRSTNRRGEGHEEHTGTKRVAA